MSCYDPVQNSYMIKVIFLPLCKLQNVDFNIEYDRSHFSKHLILGHPV